MFDTYCRPNVNNKTENHHHTKITACSGGIYKNYKESWFKRFHLQSKLAEILFNYKSYFYEKYNEYRQEDEYSENWYEPKEKGKEIIIIQIVICGDMEVMAEIMYKEDFDKYFEIPREENENGNR